MNKRSREKFQSHFVSTHLQTKGDIKKIENKNNDSKNIKKPNNVEKNVLDSFKLEKAPHLVLPLYLTEKNK